MIDMHIDWFVLFAQIVNFLILMALLKRFLYGRIIGAMDAREAKIAATFSEAEQSREKARENALQYEQSLKELEQTSAELINRARTDADAYRRELMEKVREEIDLVQTRWIETLCSERANIFHQLRRLTGVEVYAIARQVLNDLADVALEERIAQVLAGRIETLEGEEREKILSLTAAGEPIRILSFFTLSPEARRRLDQAIHRSLGPSLAGMYETADDVLSGCELRIDGYKVAWSVKDYLGALEEKFHLCLYRESKDGKLDPPDGGPYGEGIGEKRGHIVS
jgi:F-type H+-transporting ATPase subunit b